MSVRKKWRKIKVGKKTEQSKKLAAMAAMLTLCACALFGNFIREDSLFDIVIRQAKSEGYLRMLHSAAPALFYEKKEMGGVGIFMDWIMRAVPVYGYVAGLEEYATQSESEISYEDMIAKEAADENYVDEKTGKLVASGTSEDSANSDGWVETDQEGAGSANGQFTPNQTKVVTFAPEKLNDFDFLIQNFYVIDRTTTIDRSRLDASDLLSRSMKLTHGADTPQILIYHTHSQERFADSSQDAADSIVGAGAYLAELLTGYGFNVLHHTGEYDVATRDDAYAKAGPAVEKILKENPGIEIVIDLHRDGVAEGTRLVTDVQGKQMASIMFFNGLSYTTANGDISYLPNPYIQDNLAFSLQMQIAADEYYPGFSRAIYLKGYRYNMHYCPKTLLVEAGAQTNTVQEIHNAMEPLADLLAKVVSP